MPIYETIARDLLGAIKAGTYPVGALIPTEHDLAERYGVSRQTVRAAMRRLTELGAVSRRKGSGTRVEPREPQEGQQGFQQTLASLADLVALATITRRDIRLVEPWVMDRRAAQRLGCPPGSRWQRLAYVRVPIRGRALPMAWVDCFVDERYGEILAGLEHDDRLISEIVAARFGTTAEEVRQTVAAAALPDVLSGALQAEAGSPALSVIRRYADRRGHVFLVTESLHPAERYRVTSVLRRIPPARTRGRRSPESAA